MALNVNGIKFPPWINRLLQCTFSSTEHLSCWGVRLSSWDYFWIWEMREERNRRKIIISFPWLSHSLKDIFPPEHDKIWVKIKSFPKLKIKPQMSCIRITSSTATQCTEGTIKNKTEKFTTDLWELLSKSIPVAFSFE